MIPRAQHLTPILLKLHPPRLKRILTAPHAKPRQVGWESQHSFLWKPFEVVFGLHWLQGAPCIVRSTCCLPRDFAQCGLCSRHPADGRSGIRLGRARHCVSAFAALCHPLAASAWVIWKVVGVSSMLLDRRMEVAFHQARPVHFKLQAPS